MPRPQSWTHDREHFYKYTTASTAKLIFANRSLRWSSPVLFNDPFDAQFDLHVEYDRARVVETAMVDLWEKYCGNKPIVVGNPLGLMLVALRDLAPNIPRKELEESLLAGLVEGIDKAEARLPETHAEMRAVIAELKLLCFSEVFDNILMWAHYAEAHQGAVLRFSCIEELDSAWGAAQPVDYQEKMPRLLDEQQTIELMTGQAGVDRENLLDNALLTKAIDWAYEREWRVLGGWNPEVT